MSMVPLLPRRPKLSYIGRHEDMKTPRGLKNMKRLSEDLTKQMDNAQWYVRYQNMCIGSDLEVIRFREKSLP